MKPSPGTDVIEDFSFKQNRGHQTVNDIQMTGPHDDNLKKAFFWNAYHRSGVQTSISLCVPLTLDVICRGVFLSPERRIMHDIDVVIVSVSNTLATNAE